MGSLSFQYAGSFFYYRLPRDRWAEEMLALKAMGLNTLDVLPMWNWHEPEEGQTDYDGHTNPRRDLKHVFELAAFPGSEDHPAAWALRHQRVAQRWLSRLAA